MNRAKLIERLELDVITNTTLILHMPNGGGEFGARLRQEVKRIRSIMRRLKRCPVCAGRGFQMEIFRGKWRSCDDEWDSYPCQRCNGTGKIA